MVEQEKRHIRHHIRGIRPVLRVMRSLGFEDKQCLYGTGISVDLLDDPDSSISLDQEHAFYRNILTVSGDPLIGLKVGCEFRYESYGILGYAMMSAQTVRDITIIASQFSALTFSHFKISLFEGAGRAVIGFNPHYTIPPDLLQVYTDRDLQASFIGVKSVGFQFEPDTTIVKLMHNDVCNRKRYEDYYQCKVEFEHSRNEVEVDSELMDWRVPQRDWQASQYCLKQCERLIQQMEPKSEYVDKVRGIIVSRPGTFLSVAETAQRMACSVRTLRRKLNNVNSSYLIILNEIRYELAQGYLQSDMRVERIAEMLGFSDAASFSHAFKRWSGQPPSVFRQRPHSNT